MYVVLVTPFSKGIKTEFLSYFSPKFVAPGSIVTIPVRKKEYKGLVIETRAVEDLKQEIKNSDFGIKKIKSVNKNFSFDKNFIFAASETAKYFLTSAGAIINFLIPKHILDDISKISFHQDAGAEKPSKGNKFVIQTEDEERFASYKNIIRSEFAKGRSVFFCVPTIEDAHYAAKKLSKGIETSTFVLHGDISKKKILETWQKATAHEGASLVIATGKYFSLPIRNLGAIILERENSGGYKTMMRPYFDFRKFAEFYATSIGADLYLGDFLLRAETLWRFDQHELTEYNQIKFRSLSTTKTAVIDMKNKSKAEKAFPLFSNQMKDMLRDNHTNNHRAFLYVSRKGLSPLIVCGDCGHVVTCNKCSAPVVLYGKDTKEPDNYFRCHACGEQRYSGEKCAKCQSWKLTEIGIGIDKVSAQILDFLPEAKIFVLDKNKAPTPKKATEIVSKFLETPGGILVGTEMALLYMREPIENVGVISIDTMLSIPDFQIRERILKILLSCRLIAMQNFLIQTRKIEDEIFDNAVTGNLANFYRQEFLDRKKFNYPPFSTIVKISTTAVSKQKLEHEFETLQKYFMPEELAYFPAFVERIRGRFVMNGIIKIPKMRQLEEVLIHKLRNLPPQYKVEIDAQSVI